jgi:hypothetical protein
MSALMCSICPATELPVMVDGSRSDPPGWSVITLTGQPLVNRVLCPACTATVRKILVPAAA